MSPPIKSTSISNVSVDTEIILADEALVKGCETATDSLLVEDTGESGTCVGISFAAVSSGAEINGAGIGAGLSKLTTGG